ncbi:MAG: uridine phosphorylase [bacterium]|nr:uridine phosphorylase [bacterium]MBU1918395.1 uridine phosphorylase [bacterium]
MKIKNINPELAKMETDILYHMGLDSSMNLKATFSDTRYVCMGGSSERALTFAKKAAHELDIPIQDEAILPIGKSERFSLYKVGPVVSVSHGMGMPSISILMHEITKLMYYAGAESPDFIRIGTSGGVGVDPGTVVLSEEALNGNIEPYYELAVLGETKRYPTKLDKGLNEALFETRGDLSVVMGKTVGVNCFYEEQARIDGALYPGYDLDDKMTFIKKIYEKGVRNFEMEAPQFASFCMRAGLRGAVVCVALLNRLHGDQVTSTSEQLADFSDRAQQVVLNYIKSRER